MSHDSSGGLFTLWKQSIYADNIHQAQHPNLEVYSSCVAALLFVLVWSGMGLEWGWIGRVMTRIKVGSGTTNNGREHWEHAGRPDTLDRRTATWIGVVKWSSLSHTLDHKKSAAPHLKFGFLDGSGYVIW